MLIEFRFEVKVQSTKMTGKIIINTERCKGCGLCVQVCPRASIAISKRSNKSGYFPAKVKNSDCTGWAACAIICPEAVIEVSRDNDIVAVEAGTQKKPELTRENL